MPPNGANPPFAWRPYSLLNSELKRRRIVPCACQMPLAFMIERPDESSANWRIGHPAPCRHGCDVLIAEVVAEMWTKSDLLDFNASAGGTAKAKPEKQDQDES